MNILIIIAPFILHGALCHDGSHMYFEVSSTIIYGKDDFSIFCDPIITFSTEIYYLKLMKVLQSGEALDILTKRVMVGGQFRVVWHDMNFKERANDEPQSQDNPTVTMKIPKENVKYTDRGEYKCEIVELENFEEARYYETRFIEVQNSSDEDSSTFPSSVFSYTSVNPTNISDSTYQSEVSSASNKIDISNDVTTAAEFQLSTGSINKHTTAAPNYSASFTANIHSTTPTIHPYSTMSDEGDISELTNTASIVPVLITEVTPSLTLEKNSDTKTENSISTPNSVLSTLRANTETFTKYSDQTEVVTTDETIETTQSVLKTVTANIFTTQTLPSKMSRNTIPEEEHTEVTTDETIERTQPALKTVTASTLTTLTSPSKMSQSTISEEEHTEIVTTDEKIETTKPVLKTITANTFTTVTSSSKMSQNTFSEEEHTEVVTTDEKIEATQSVLKTITANTFTTLTSPSKMSQNTISEEEHTEVVTTDKTIETTRPVLKTITANIFTTHTLPSKMSRNTIPEEEHTEVTTDETIKRTQPALKTVTASTLTTLTSPSKMSQSTISEEEHTEVVTTDEKIETTKPVLKTITANTFTTVTSSSKMSQNTISEEEHTEVVTTDEKIETTQSVLKTITANTVTTLTSPSKMSQNTISQEEHTEVVTTDETIETSQPVMKTVTAKTFTTLTSSSKMSQNTISGEKILTSEQLVTEYGTTNPNDTSIVTDPTNLQDITSHINSVITLSNRSTEDSTGANLHNSAKSNSSIPLTVDYSVTTPRNYKNTNSVWTLDTTTKNTLTVSVDKSSQPDVNTSGDTFTDQQLNTAADTITHDPFTNAADRDKHNNFETSNVRQSLGTVTTVTGTIHYTAEHHFTGTTIAEGKTSTQSSTTNNNILQITTTSRSSSSSSPSNYEIPSNTTTSLIKTTMGLSSSRTIKVVTAPEANISDITDSITTMQVQTTFTSLQPGQSNITRYAVVFILDSKKYQQVENMTLNSPSSTEFREVQAGVVNFWSSKIGNNLWDVDIELITQHEDSSLFVRHTVKTENDMTAAVVAASRHVVNGQDSLSIGASKDMLVKSATITFGAYTATISSSSSMDLCYIFTSLSPCEAGYECRLLNREPACEPRIFYSGDTQIALYGSIGTAVLLITIAIVIGCRNRKIRIRKRRNAMNNYIV